MSLMNKVWVPYGKDNSFVNGYDKMDTMSNAEYAEWLNADVTLSNGDVITTIKNNRNVGYVCGALAVINATAIAGGVVALTVYLRSRRRKATQQAQATKAE